MVLLALLILQAACILALSPDDIKETLYEKCPLNMFAYRDGDDLRTNDTLRPCCSSCVSTDCGIRGPCCPDVTITKMTSTCTSTLHTMKHDPESPFQYIPFDIYAYWMVGTCDPTFEGTHHEENCLNRTIADPFNISFVQPIVDSTTKIIYANKFCALCNGVQQNSMLQDFFQSSVRCLTNYETFVTSPFISLEQSLRGGDCFYIFLPQSLVYVYESQCFKDIIDRCNVSGLMKAYDQVTEEACEAYDMPYTSYYNDMYANIHCYLCNDIFQEQSHHVCPMQPEYTGYGPGSFMVILGGDRENVNVQRSGEGACSATKFWDPKQERCRNIICPGAMLFTESGCVSLFSSMKEIYWVLNILWKIPVDKNIELQNFTNVILDFTVEHINRSLYMTFTNVSKIHTLIFKDKNPGDVLWVFVSTVFKYGYTGESEDDPIIQFIKGFRDFQKGQTVYVRYGMNIQVEGILLDSNDIQYKGFDTTEIFDRSLELDYDRRSVGDYDSSYQGDNFLASITWNCELVILEKDEYSLLMYGSIILTRNGLKLSAVEHVRDYDESRVSICIDDLLYEEHTGSVVTESMASKLLTGLSIGTTLVSIFCIILVLIALLFVKVERTAADTLKVCHCICVIVSQCLQLSARYVNEYELFCKILGVAVHFFQVNTAAWIIIIALHCFNSSNVPLKEDARCLRKNALFVSLLIAIFVPSAFVAINISLSLMVSGSGGIGYGGEYCDVSSKAYLAFLSFLPTIIPILSSSFIFKWIIYNSEQGRMNKDNANNNHDSKNYFVFSVISMFYWLLKFLSISLDREDFVNMAMVFDLAQGMWLFRSFVPAGTISHIIAKLVCFKDRNDVNNDF